MLPYPNWQRGTAQTRYSFSSNLNGSTIWASSKSATTGGCKPLSFGNSWVGTSLAHQHKIIFNLSPYSYNGIITPVGAVMGSNPIKGRGQLHRERSKNPNGESINALKTIICSHTVERDKHLGSNSPYDF